MELFTADVAARYRSAGAKLSVSGDSQAIGERRRLIGELMRNYGILEIEATNVLNGRNIPEYVKKYERKSQGNEVETKVLTVQEEPIKVDDWYVQQKLEWENRE